MALSQFLKVCRQRASEQSKSGDDIRTVYQSPAYQRLLGHAERLEQDRIPPELFDGFSVLKNVNEHAVEGSILAGHVSDVLDAVVRMIRARIAGGE